MSFDFAEVFTVAARQVVPLARSQGLSFTFDCQSAGVRVAGDPAGLQGALHRVFLSVIGLSTGGSLVISARGDLSQSPPSLQLRAAAVGLEVTLEAITAAHHDLGLSRRQAPSVDAGTLTAAGVCPHTQGQLEMTAMPGHGALVTLTLAHVEPPLDADVPAPHAQGAHAWLVNVDDQLARSWQTRLARLGWITTRIASFQEAATRARATPRHALPSLVIVLETGNPARDGTLDLAPLLHTGTRLIYAVQAGSASLRHPAHIKGYEVHVYPLSPQELDEITRNLSSPDDLTNSTPPEPLRSPAPPTILIVDDGPMNLIVGQGFAEALGYEVRTATDGMAAIEACRQQAPDMVLMDLHMPVLGGAEATMQLRAMQRNGDVPPFPIVILTAGWSAEVRRQCIDAGADECLAKPLSMADMDAELARRTGHR